MTDGYLRNIFFVYFIHFYHVPLPPCLSFILKNKIDVYEKKKKQTKNK